MKKSVSFLYPLGDCIRPITGGQVYDGRFYNYLKNKKDLLVDYIDGENLGVTSPMNMLSRLLLNVNRINKSSVVFFNSACFVYYIPYLIVSKLFFNKTKIYAIHHHYRYLEFQGVSKMIRFMLENVCLRLCSGVISPNPYTSGQLAKFINKKKIISLRMSFDKGEDKLSSFSSRHFLFVGTVYFRKGIHLLVESIGLMSKDERDGLVVDIVGSLDDTIYINKLCSRIKQLGIEENIIFVGRVSEEKLKHFYMNSYAFVFPSLLEGYGMVLAEAMSFGLPVIAFNNSAIPFLVTDRLNGLLVENKNVNELKNALLLIKNNLCMHNDLSEGAKRTFMNLPSLGEFYKDVDSFLKEI